jgi:hypothetical protein
LPNKFPVCALLGAQVRWALQQFIFFLIGKRTHGPFARFEPVLLMPVKLAGELDEILSRERTTRLVSRMIAPHTQRHAIAGIGENEFAVRLLFACQLWRRTFHLHMHPRWHRAILRRSANFSERHQVHVFNLPRVTTGALGG